MPTNKPHGQQFAEAMQTEHIDEAATEAARRVAASLFETAKQVAEFEAIQLDDEIPLDKQLFSLGNGCQLLQQLPRELRKAMKAAGVKFVLSINDVPYLDGKGIVAVGRYLREARDQERRATESN